MNSNIKAILASQGLTLKQGQELLYKLLDQYKLISLISSEVTSKILVVTPHCEYVNQIIVRALCTWGFNQQNVILSSKYSTKEIEEMTDISFVYVCEGNAFEVMQYILQNGWNGIIKTLVIEKNAIYIGASAGAMIATEGGISLAKDFDDNAVCLQEKDFKGLGLVAGAIIPHYEYSELKQYLACLKENYRYSVTNIRDDEALLYFNLENKDEKPKRIRYV